MKPQKESENRNIPSLNNRGLKLSHKTQMTTIKIDKKEQSSIPSKVYTSLIFTYDTDKVK